MAARLLGIATRTIYRHLEKQDHPEDFDETSADDEKGDESSPVIM
jgi:hypothetical protein